MANAKGVDCSRWQGTIGWQKVKDSGVEFAFIKASQGTTWKDPIFEQNKAGTRRVGVLPGYYHFATLQDPIKEADWFLKCVGDIRENELLALDAETGQTPEWCRKFLDRVTAKVGFKPLIYAPVGNGANWTAVSSGDYGLWVARYGLNTGSIPWLFKPRIGPWKFYVIWQYTSRGRVPGIVGNCDLDLCNASLEVLKKYGK